MGPLDGTVLGIPVWLVPSWVLEPGDRRERALPSPGKQCGWRKGLWEMDGVPGRWGGPPETPSRVCRGQKKRGVITGPERGGGSRGGQQG